MLIASPSQSHFPELLTISTASLSLSNSRPRLLLNNFFYALKVAADRIARSGAALLNSHDGAWAVQVQLLRTSAHIWKHDGDGNYCSLRRKF